MTITAEIAILGTIVRASLSNVLTTASCLLLIASLMGCEEGPRPSLTATPAPPVQDQPLPVAQNDCVKDQLFDPGGTLPRRLTDRELKNTVTDLFGFDLEGDLKLPPEEEMLGFDNNARALQVTPLHAERIMEIAEEVARRVAQDLETFLPCLVNTSEDAHDGCVRTFIDTEGARAWRRPITGEESDRLLALYRLGAGPQANPTNGVALMVSAMLQSPHFLYRVEVGRPVPGQPGLSRLTPHEVATRLSYFLWRSMPDDALFEAARRDQLNSPDDLMAHVDRMLESPRARAAFWTFFAQWLHIDEVLGLERDERFHPNFGPEDARQMYEQFQDFVDRAVWADDGTMEDLFSRSFELAGDPSSVERVGILSQPALLAVTSKPNMTSPVHRGVFVREQLLCTALPPPPADAMVVAPDPDPSLTTREIFEIHTAEEACAGCHRLIDPLGMAFEHFDEMGRWRDIENGHPVDAQGEVIGTLDMNGDFYGVAELAHRMARSEQVHRCVTTQLFRYAVGRGEQPSDACTLQTMYDTYVASGYNFRVLIQSLVTHAVFMHRGEVVQ